MADDGLERRDYGPGEVIFAQGESGEEAYIVEAGMVEIARVKGAAEVIIGTVNTNGLLGEMALIDSSPRMATARATRKTTCIVVPKRVFQRILGESNPVLVTVLNTLLQRLRGEAVKSANETFG